MVQPRDRIFVKGYGFLTFAKNMGKNISKNISNNLSSKYSQKPLDLIQKAAEATSNLIGNKIANTITGFQKIPNRIIQKQL